MSNFAPVVPLHIAAELKKYDLLGNYHLLLAHDVLAKPGRYLQVYGHTKHSGGTYIMDNSLIELGEPLPLLNTLEAAKIVGAQYAVLPDFLGDMDKTLKASFASLQYYEEHPDEDKDQYEGIGFLGVIQGKSIQEMMYCAAELAAMHPNITAFSIPRVAQQILGSRVGITRRITAAFPDKFIHLLGFSNDVVDDVITARLPGVAGIDSAVPIRMALQRGFCIDSTIADPGPRKTFWTDPLENYSTDNWLMALHNIAKVRDWIQR